MFERLISRIKGLENKILPNNTESRNNYSLSQENGSVFSPEDINVNGKLDEAFSQGDAGDCWLLSSILAMSYSESGKQVLSDSITPLANGDIKVSFDGNKTEYTVSESELIEQNKQFGDKTSYYSTGDDDVLAVELAIEKMVADDSVNTKFSIADGGNPYSVFKTFGADELKIASAKDELNEALAHFQDIENDCSMTLGVIEQSVCGLKANHAYTVKNVDDENVTLIDPWDTSEEITVNRTDLINSYEHLNIIHAEFGT